MLDEPGLKLGKLEVVVLLGRLRDLAVNLGPGSVQVAILIGEELFLAGGVPVGLLPLINQALVEELLQELLHDLLVTRFGRTDIIVVRYVKIAEHALKDRGNLVDEDLGFNATLEGGLLDLLAVLVKTGEKVHLTAAHAHMARDHVGEDFLIGVAEVRRTVGIVDGRGDVERTGHEKIP